jgi:hypothetical protein
MLISYSYFFFESLALLTAIVQFKKIKGSSYKYFLPFLVFIVLYEFGSIWDWFYINHSNLYITNITEIACFLFYSIFLRSIIKNNRYKKIITSLIIFSQVCACINMLFIQGFWKLDTATILLQFAIIIFIVCLNFYEIMNSIEPSDSIIKLPVFWLSTGLLFFCLAQFLFFSSFAYMAYKHDYHYILLFQVIANIANAILYTCLVVCFLCFRKTRKST